jgi:hypothetical protein
MQIGNLLRSHCPELCTSVSSQLSDVFGVFLEPDALIGRHFFNGRTGKRSYKG